MSSTAGLAPRSDPDTRARSLAEAVRLLYARGRIAHVTVIGVAGLVAVVFWSHVPPATTLTWLAAVWVVAGWRLWLGAAYARRAPTAPDAARWARAFVVGSALTGSAWGAAALLFCPQASLAHQIFLTFVVGGLSAGAASADASHPRAFLAYTAPALVPLVAQFVASGDAVHLAMGGLTAVYGVATGLISKWGSETVREAIEARFGNERLLESLRESEERLRLALAAANQAEWEYDVARDVLIVGPRGLGETRGGEWRLSRSGWAELVHPDDRAEASAHVEACVAGRTASYESEFRARPPGDAERWRWVRARGRVTHRDGAGRAQKLMGTLMDVTEVHSLQEQLVEAARLASLGKLTAGIAHEINNPLAWVSSNLSFIRDQLRGDPSSPRAIDPSLEEPLRDAMLGAERIGAVVKAMRTLSRATTDDRACDVDAGSELAEALRMVRNQLVQRAAVVVEVPERLPPVRAVPGELSRVFLNLLVNAGHAIAPGSAEENRIAVSARVAGPELIIDVADTGHGMTPEVRRRVFEPFFTTKPFGEGSGLGLAIVRSIVQASGGRIEVESEPGRGALFRVHLPIAAPRAAEAPEAPAQAAGEELRGRIRVLIVDDEQLIGRSLARLLAPEVAAEVVSSAPDALRRVDAGEDWDAVLCDVMMPSMDGIALYEALAARASSWADRVVFMTGGAFGVRAEEFVAETDVPIVAKPVEKRQLLKVLARVADRAERSRAEAVGCVAGATGEGG
jgi:signal transduction histidine kinase